MNKVRGGTPDVVYKAGLFRLIGARTNKANKNCRCNFLISARPHYSSIDSAERPESVHYQEPGPLLVQAVQGQRGQIAELTAGGGRCAGGGGGGQGGRARGRDAGAARGGGGAACRGSVVMRDVLLVCVCARAPEDALSCLYIVLSVGCVKLRVREVKQ